MSATGENNLGGSVGLDVTAFKAGVMELTNQMKSIETSFRASAAVMGNWSSSTQGLSERVSSLREKLSLQREALTRMNSEYQKTVTEQGAGSKSAQSLANQMFDMEKKISSTEGQLKKYSSSLQTAQKEEKENSSAAGRLGKSFMEMAEKSRQSTSNIRDHFNNLKSSISGAIAGIVAGMSLKEVIEDTDAAEKNLSQMSAVLKSTGDASGMTKQQLVELAEAQSKVTTYSAETTEKAENMLLTFTNLKSNVFPQAIQATEDMATAMHMDATQAALQLGKALNDPVKGYTKLQRIGVTFTASQIQTIKAMEKAGNTAGAQKIILQELEKEYGSSAKAAGSTLTGQIQIMQNNVKSAGVQITGAVLPIVQNILPSFVKGIQGLAAQVMAHKAQIVAAFTAVGNGIKTVFGWVESHGPLVKNLVIGIASAVGVWKTAILTANVVQAVNNALTVTAAISTGGLKAGEEALAAAKGSTTLATMALSAATIKDTAVRITHAVATKASTAAQTLFNAALNANPIGIVITLIAALVAALVILFNKNKAFHDWVLNAFAAVKSTAQSFVTAISGFFTVTIPRAWAGLVAIFNAVPAWWVNLWTQVGQLFTNTWNSIVSFFTTTIPAWIAAVGQWFQQLPYNIGLALGMGLRAVINFGTSVWSWATTQLPQIINGIIQWFQQLPGRIWSALLQAIDKVKQWGSDTWSYVSQAVPKIINGIGTWFSELPGRIWTFLTQAISKIGNWGSQTYSSATSAAGRTVSGIGTWFSQLPGKIWTALLDALQSVKSWCSNLLSTAGTEIPKFVESVVGFMQQLPGKMLDIGKNIVYGIWNGITGATTWLWDHITGWCNDLVKGFKDGLGIHSPSKLFADVIGKNLALGIGQGFSDNMKSVTASMAAAVPTNFSASMGLRPAYVGGYSATAPKTFSPTIQNHVSVPQYLYASINLNGKQIVAEITPLVGRTLESKAQDLSYARGR